jgi:hypothetical protein
VRVQQDAQGFLLDFLDELQRALPKPAATTATTTATASSDSSSTTDDSSSSTQPAAAAAAAAAADFIAQTLEGKHVSQISLAEGGGGSSGNGSDIREQEQPFMCYPLEVKNLSGLTQALAVSTAAEAVEGYRWDEVTVICVTAASVTVVAVTVM